MENRFNETMLTNANWTKVNVALVDVTPAMAAEWLECNIKTNRRLKKSVVTKYVNDMKAGKFGLNPDAITFNENGELVNGQHRLTAVVKANVTVRMFVVFGFPITPAELLNVDRISVRTIADNMDLAGISDDVYQRSVSTASTFLRLKLNINNPSPEQIMEHITKNYKAYADVNSITKMGRSGGSGRMKVVVACAVLAAYLAGEDFKALSAFCQVYRTHETTNCEGYGTGHAERLREELNKTKNAGYLQEHVAESYINAFARNSGKCVKRNDYYPIKPLVQNV